MKRSSGRPHAWAATTVLALAAAFLALGGLGPAFAHGIAGKDAAFVAASHGPQIIPFIYLGAKHMVTGYDHLLFILGVIFFLYRLSHVALYVTMFSIGHSITLLTGVLTGVQVNPYLIDAIIGLSVAYKAFDNLDGFRTLFGWSPDTRLMVLVFGLFHGLGLATKLQALQLSRRGLALNLVSFNVGVEIGQLLFITAVLFVLAGARALRRYRPGPVWVPALTSYVIGGLASFWLWERIAAFWQ